MGPKTEVEAQSPNAVTVQVRVLPRALRARVAQSAEAAAVRFRFSLQSQQADVSLIDPVRKLTERCQFDSGSRHSGRDGVKATRLGL